MKKWECESPFLKAASSESKAQGSPMIVTREVQVLESNRKSPSIQGQSCTYRLRFVDRDYEFHTQLRISSTASDESCAGGGLDYGSDINSTASEHAFHYTRSTASVNARQL